uniref:Uncharacterized protein n=1 Tax=Anguilla anguilla TaxID=7936 RepID=A0A0E9XTQ8_ANGAN
MFDFDKSQSELLKLNHSYPCYKWIWHHQK